MPKPSLSPEYAKLEQEIIDTFIAGHHEWRPDLSYPESYSDMQAGVRALLRRYEIKQRPVDAHMHEFLDERYKDCKCAHCQR